MQGLFDAAQGSADGRIWTSTMLHGIESLAGQEQAYPCLIPAFLGHQGDARFKDVFMWFVEVFEPLGDSS
jgi:hypothetical protein